jgi:CII-binding regulator of phage lambda lysogenization HflD
MEYKETLSNERLMQELTKTPEMKRRLVVRLALDILESEAFLEAYPRTENLDELKEILTRVLHKNRVSTETGRTLLKSLAESYSERYSHSDKSVGPSSGHESQS